jgi:pimeloyl-ACP methyl ester carboxylesterase
MVVLASAHICGELRASGRKQGAAMNSARALLLITLAVASGSSVAQTETTPPPPARGQVLEAPQQIGVYSESDLLSKISDGTITQWLLKRIFEPKCAVAVYQLRYGTVGGRGEPTTASGALMIPTGDDPVCQGPRPVALYAHGKRNFKTFNIADFNGSNAYEGVLLGLALAGSGYIVVAPNYAGYDSSTLDYHPFMNADQQSADMMDALTAARASLAALGAAENGKLFVTGYSEGGYVAMATHRALQAAGIPVTASAPMSGPYALSAFADAMFLGDVGAGAVEEFLMLSSSYQHAYGSLDLSYAGVFEPKYVSAAGLLPGTVGTDTLIAQGSMPNGTVFSSTPPTPDLAAMTPADGRGFGPDNLITNEFRLAYIQDALAAPDGGFPNTTTGLPPEAPANPFRQALKYNDLRNWVPTSPLLMCAGDEDPVVFYENTQLMEGYWAMTAPESYILTLDVDSPASRGGPYKNIKKRFAETKKILKWIQGREWVGENYHALLVPAFCIQAATSFFDQF